MKRDSCKTSARSRRKLVDHFTDLHEGSRPRSVTCGEYSAPSGRIRTLGRITAIQYRKRTPKGLETYWHPFAVHAQPRIGLDQRGKVVIWAGRYRVLTGGITDRSRSSVKPESLPRKPASLSDLGIIEWIRYDVTHGNLHTGRPVSNAIGEHSERSQTLRFSARSLLAHDEQGNLHVLGTAHEEKSTMAKRNPVNIVSKKPGGAKNEIADVLMAGLLVGGTVAIFNEAAVRLTPAGLLGYKRAAAQLVAGLGLAAVGAKMNAPAELVLGLGAGGVATGGIGAVHEWQMRRLTAAQAPGGYAQLGPGGMPVGYSRLNRAGCAVGTR
jgi:hypothetical protein